MKVARGVLAALALQLVAVGLYVGMTAPLFTAGHLIAGPGLIALGGLTLARMRQVQEGSR